MTTLVATSVVRGSHQGESHGGVYLISLDKEQVLQPVDWNTMDIDWQGRGWDRGLRGIEFDQERIFIAASDELFVFSPKFELLDSHRCPFLKHCHEIFCYERRLYLTSTAYDSILGFDLDNNRFSWGLNITRDKEGFRGNPFNPSSEQGPLPSNELHLNNVFCTSRGMFISGMKTGAVLVFNGRTISEWVSLPSGAHNAQPYREGVLFNDTQADLVRFVTREEQFAFKVPRYAESDLTHTDLDDSRIARQAFGRGLCTVDESVIAAGSSPSTVTLHEIDQRRSTQIITLTYDIRNAIHGLQVWPFE